MKDEKFYRDWARDIMGIVEGHAHVVRFQEWSDRSAAIELIAKSLREGVEAGCNDCRSDARGV